MVTLVPSRVPEELSTLRLSPPYMRLRLHLFTDPLSHLLFLSSLSLSPHLVSLFMVHRALAPLFSRARTTTCTSARTNLPVSGLREDATSIRIYILSLRYISFCSRLLLCFPLGWPPGHLRGQEFGMKVSVSVSHEFHSKTVSTLPPTRGHSR